MLPTACHRLIINRFTAVFVLSLFIPLVFVSQGAWANSNGYERHDVVTQQHYICTDRNVDIPVTYWQTKSGEFYAVLQAEGKQIPMQRRQVWREATQDAESKQLIAQGKRKKSPIDGKILVPANIYIAQDEQESYRWQLSRNGNGKLSFLAADDTAQEEVVYKTCRIAVRD